MLAILGYDWVIRHQGGYVVGYRLRTVGFFFLPFSFTFTFTLALALAH
jgi:hypothetical protein